MSARRVFLDRLSLRLHGISPQIAQDAMEGLDRELARRISRLPIAALAPVDMAGLSISADMPRSGGSAALRALIAERVVAGLAGRTGDESKPDEER